MKTAWSRVAAATIAWVAVACGGTRGTQCVRACEKEESCERARKQTQGEVPVGDMHALCVQVCQGQPAEDEDVAARIDGCLSKPCDQFDACMEAARRP